MVIFVHMASVWVPFTSESKEAIADYDEIRKEITLALRECGRRLGVFIKRRERAHSEFKRRNIFELYIEEVADAIHRITGNSRDAIKRDFLRVAEQVTEADLASEDRKLDEASDENPIAAREELLLLRVKRIVGPDFAIDRDDHVSDLPSQTRARTQRLLSHVL